MQLYRISLITLLPALVAAALAWAAVKIARDELSTFDGFDGLHLE